ncbi:DUF998 domain-containing protein [Gordonia lacunae]|uniref:DUF998 domain-containing protein n=1 Tax=Gordonia lacunae TaxID=417102 RepID=A0A243Q2P2_9ACTN|nr:DUF998 domain-containing protein [Gordonia lacunae]OUC75528.1 hypothetical protein CA982_26020 [Gordonia lacunae]
MVSLLLAVSILAAVGRLALLATLHIVGRAHYSPIKHAVSDYAVGPTHTLATAMNVVTAVLFAALAAVVWWGYPHWALHATTTAYLVALSTIFLILPALPTDLEGEQATLTGRIHLLAAITWFALSYTLTGRFSELLAASNNSFAGVLHALNMIAMLSLIALIISLLPPLRPHLFGITERVFILAISTFFLLLPVALVIEPTWSAH